jgi:hypothetical protein
VRRGTLTLDGYGILSLLSGFKVLITLISMAGSKSLNYSPVLYRILSQVSRTRCKAT